MKSIISLTNVRKSFKVRNQDVEILHGIDVEIHEGEFVMIIGPSGSGKSTLMHTMIGMEPPTSGKVVFLDNDLAHLNDDQVTDFRKQHLSMIYQQSNWIKSFDVISNVAFPLSLKGIPKHQRLSDAMAALNSIGMSNWASFRPTELSGGQQQKVALARALVSNPNIIFADEPTGNLDYQSGQELMNLFSKLNKEGKTIVMVTHALENMTFATRVLRVFDGQIVEDFDPRAEDPEKLIGRVASSMRKPQSANAELVKAIQKESVPPTVQVRKRRFRLRSFLRELENIVAVFLLVTFALIFRTFYAILDIKPIAKIFGGQHYRLSSIYDRVIKLIKRKDSDSISASDLLDISIKNLAIKKSRSFITIGGVAIGIGFTALLISIGFGLERLVVERVARLDQLQQLNVRGPISETVQIDDEAIATFSKVKDVTQVLPIIGLAGKITYADATADAVVYGVQSDYLEKSDTILASGRFFGTNDTTVYAEGETEPTIASAPILSAPVASAPLSASRVDGEVDAKVKLVDIRNKAPKEVVVNTSFLQLISLDENDALGKDIEVTLIGTSTIVDSNVEVQSYPAKYEIVGVITNSDIPVIHIPLLDAKSLGIDKYSEARVIATDKNKVYPVRQILELSGYRTSSILDTIEQIERVFATLRSALGIIGMVALAVASFGMFNTLTVSLLERTREVGLMKAIGMKSREVKDLFLTESIIMGLSGGLLGIFLGVSVGFIISLLLTAISVSRGSEPIVINYLPPTTALAIVMLASFTGLLTGFYPARRATSISALNALRYE